jgi:hypothetical protein
VTAVSDSGSPIVATCAALVKPAPLAIAAATGLLAWLVNPMWAVPGGLLFVLVVYALGPAKWRAAKLAEELGLDLATAPPGLKRWHALLRDSLQQVQRDLAQAQGPNARFLQPVRAEVEELGRDIRRLIRQAFAVHRYLNSTNPQFIQARINHLDSQIANTPDAYSRQQLVEAAAALRQQLANCEELRILLSRTEATLENMQASLQAIGSSVIKLSAGGNTEVQLARDESLQRLASARGTVAALEEVLETVELA